MVVPVVFIPTKWVVARSPRMFALPEDSPTANMGELVSVAPPSRIDIQKAMRSLLQTATPCGRAQCELDITTLSSCTPPIVRMSVVEGMD
jgi:hypothetical protein